jgi:predicted nucleic acid-binding protein
MMKDLKGKLAIDTSALIELIYCDSLGQKLKKALETDMVEAYTTELAITELRYVLCRKLGWQQSKERVNKLLASGYFKVEDTSQLINEAAKIKCQRAISLPDCFISRTRIGRRNGEKIIRHYLTFLGKARIGKTELQLWIGQDLNPRLPRCERGERLFLI